MDEFRSYARRELIFLALGTMDVCVITPLFAALLFPILSVSPWALLLILLGGVLVVHYLARLSFWAPVSPTLRVSLLSLGMLVSGLLIVHHLLYSRAGLLSVTWLNRLFVDLQRGLISQGLLIFVAVVFLWWRGLVLAQRQIDSQSVAFRFRLGVILLAATSIIAGAMVSWPYQMVVFLFFFASLLGIALARAEEVGRQYGGRQSPFDLGWLATLALVSLAVLSLAVGLTLFLNSEIIGRLLRPLLVVFRLIVFVLIYALAWLLQFVVQFLMAIFRRFDFGPAFQDVLDQVQVPEAIEEGPVAPQDPVFTPEQLAALRLTGAVSVALILLGLVALSLYRLRAQRAGRPEEERESVWEGADLRRGVSDLIQRGRRRLGSAAEALGRTRIGRLFAALTIRRIYAHMAALAEERGYPRALDETPYDYLPTLREAFPEHQQEVARITDAYVAVHYGEMPERSEELEAVRAAWQQIRQLIA
jgi:hypothetical protein